MRGFDEIFAMAARRKGGAERLEEILARTASPPRDTVAAMPDDRILAAMTRWIFYAGFSHKVIDDKWPAFEKAFHGFEPHACAFMTEEDVSVLLQDRGIVRNGAKIRAVQLNAKLLVEIAGQHGSAARFFADWPDSDYTGLLDLLKKKGSHLGGDSAMRFVRSLGKPAFVTSPDMVTALIREGVLSKPPGGKGDLARIQQAFNQWSAESGRDLTAISRTLAMSVESGA